MSSHDMIERVDPSEAIRQLRQSLTKANEKAEAWRAWALTLEIQMRREGWTNEDLFALDIHRPE